MPMLIIKSGKVGILWIEYSSGFNSVYLKFSYVMIQKYFICGEGRAGHGLSQYIHGL